jgi:hypothetical protein
MLFKIIEIKNVQNLSGGKFLIKDMIAENLITKRKSEISFTEINEGSKLMTPVQPSEPGEMSFFSLRLTFRLFIHILIIEILYFLQLLTFFTPTPPKGGP